MNKDEMIELLKTDVEGWNKYVRERKGRNPLERTNMPMIDLQGADLQNANLRNANLEKTDLNRANLFNSNLSQTNFVDTILTNTILDGATLQGTNFFGALLKDTSFIKSELRGTYLHKAKLFNTNFRDSIFISVLFSSKDQLNEIRHPLSEEQLANCIFEDEKNFYKRQASGTKLSEDLFLSTPLKEENNSLKIHFKDHTSWTPRDLSIFLMGIQSAYSNLLYLHTTDNDVLEHIENNLEHSSIYPPLDQEICIQSIQNGSMLIEIGKLIQEASPLSDLQMVMITLSSLATISLPLAKSAKIVSEIFKTNSETRKNNAETRKNNAETEKIKAETEKLKTETTLMTCQSAPATNQEKRELLSINAKDKEISQAISNILFANITVANNPDLVIKATKHLQIALLELAKAYKVDPEIIPPKIDQEEQ
ncbi:pentapeptide repeat-containing protein [Maridesulfovibrio sp.]|uniref:pentapeptide repeat-containing protein n=1 Tax=Maridesulfovibrio sp. TaxID=2795000 RepID=UPI0029F4AA4C|nr:pentapeptide repeat-containing protein [Maridesulfovibrio sp.]